MSEFSLWPVMDGLKIVDKDLQRHRFGDVKTWAQVELINEVDRQINAKKPVRIIVLKARQMGISTAIEGIQFSMAFLRPGMTGLVLSHENKSAEHLLGMTRHYWDSWHSKSMYDPKYVSRNTLAWRNVAPGSDSQIEVATAGNDAAGRSRTLQFLHASEVGFWKDAETLMTGMNQAIPSRPGTFIFLESTANGVGNYFHKTWEAAEAGDVDYVPLFFAWHKHPEYRASYMGMEYQHLGALDEEERVLARVLRGEHLDDTDITDRLLWRRWAIANLCQGDRIKFAQEYPANPEEAFVSTGRNVFPAAQLQQAYDEMDPAVGRLNRTPRGTVEFTTDPHGPLKVYAYPGNREVCQYAIGGDPTVGMRGDFACAQVVNMRTWEQVATWRGRIDPLRFGDQLTLLGEWYNDALLAPEANKSGAAVIARIQTIGYPNLFRHYKSNNVKGQMAQTWGFLSNMQTKPAAIANLLASVVNIHQGTGRPFLTLHDSKTYAEMRNYVHMDGDRFGNASDEEHDDTVMALAIALTAVMETAALTPGFTALAPTPTPDYVAGNRAARHYEIDGQLVPVPRPAPDWLLHPGQDHTDMFAPTE